MTTNVLLEAWIGPLGGVPPLDRVTPEAIEEAVLVGMAEKREEARVIRSETAAPTFENTLLPMERLGATLERALTAYYLWSGNFSDVAMREVRLRLEPKLSELRDAILQDSKLFERVQVVAEDPGLDEEQRRLCKRYLRNYRKAGAHLAQGDRDRVAAVNQRLSTLYTQFSDNLLADEESHFTLLTEDQLGGMSPSWIAGAAVAAEELGHPGMWAVTNTRSSAEPFLMASTERALREKVWRTYYKRGDNNDGNDNKALVAEILALRLERARLLGFETHAHLILQDQMAGTPERAMDLLRTVWSAAKAKFEREVAAMQALADADGHTLTIEPWDVRFYAERVRKEAHAFDPAVLLQHFGLDRLREGMFWAATERYGWTYTPSDAPRPHPDVTVWTVWNADGSERGLFYFDPFARKGKRSGAWMSAYRVQHGLDGGSLPLVSNNCNYLKAPEGQPTLLNLDEARTLFHEFGHAMHGLSSAVTYPTLAGTRVPRDYVEFPSQLNEHWLLTPELLGRFALHPETGAPPDEKLLAQLTAASNADSGFMTMEYLASAVMDLEMHLCTEPVDPAVFEDETLVRWGLPREVVMRHRTPQFAHVFGGESYSAGYYSYLWADVLTADAAAWFAEVGFYDSALSAELMDKVLSRGNTRDPAEAYRAFRGRDPEVSALLVERGLTE